MKKRAPALPDLATLQQLWDVVGSSLGEAVREELLYTQGVRGSSPLPPTIEARRNLQTYRLFLRTWWYSRNVTTCPTR